MVATLTASQSPTSWAIASGNTGTAFALSNAGALTTAAGLDYETLTSYTLGVTATNATGTSSAENIVVNVTNVADVVPIVTGGQSFSVAESASVSTTVGTVLVTTGDSSVTAFAITAGNTGTAFAISSGGVITTVAGLDYETLASSSAVSVGITVTNVADVVPVVTASQSFSVSESVSSGATVGTVLVTAGDTATTSFAIVSGNTGTAFAISSGGVITTAAALDYSTLASYTLGVTATNSAGASSAVNVGITVNEASAWPSSQAFTGFATVTSNSMSVPALRTPVADATFSQTNLTRISDSSEIAPSSGTFRNFGPFYSARQHWNSDNSKVIVTGYNTDSSANYAAPFERNFHLLNGTAPYAHIGPIVTSGGTGVSNHWRWSNTDPDELLYLEFEGVALKAFDVSDMTISTVHDFTADGYDRISDDFCGGVGDPSDDGRYWALGGRKSGTDWYVFVWDRTANSILCEIPVPVEPGSSYLPQVNMSPTGLFVCIWGTSGWTSGATSIDRGVSVWNKSGTYLRSINETGGSGATDIVGDHNSIGKDSAGNDVVIYFHSPDAGSNRYFVSRRLDTDQSGSPTQQSPTGMIFGAMYVTPFAFGLDGWCVISDYPVTTLNASHFNGYPLRGHIWAIKLDGSQTVYPICESRYSLVDFTLGAPYLTHPWGTPNRDLTAIMFKSSFDTDWSSGSGDPPTTFHAIIASAA